MPEKDLYVLARELSKQFTKSKYKSFLVINKFVQSDVLEKFEDNISGFVTKEDFIRETFSLIEDWERLVEWFQEEDGHPSKPSVSPKPTENAAFNERMKNISQKGRIFISYRRVDSEGYAGRIYDRLAPYFGDDAIFMDVDDIPAGVDFVKFLENEVQSCDVLIALIGRQWVNVKDRQGNRRLDNPKDFVRIEIATALKRDIRVIPVLLGGIGMPQISELPENLQSLTRRNGLPVYHHSFHADTNRLIKHLENALDAVEKAHKEQEEKGRKEREEREKAEKAERGAAEKTEQERKDRERLEREASVRKEKAEEAVRLQYEIMNAQDRGDYDEAEKFLRQSLQIAVELNDEQGRLSIQNQLVKLNQDRQNKEQMERQAAEKEEQDRKKRERLEREEKALKEKEVAERAAREKAKRDAAEKAERERKERERLERDEKSRKEKEAAEKAAREKAKREAEERVKKEIRERKEREEKTHMPSKITIGGTEFLRIPKGKFLMGHGAEKHEVDIPYDYFLARFPVTNQLFRKFMDPIGYRNWWVFKWNKKTDHPVVYIHWNTAREYCQWLSQVYSVELPAGYIFRLPTEAEWEKAARGTDGRLYPWGNEFDKTKCNSKETSSSSQTTPVSKYSPQGDSPYGISDMVGNVWEWTHSLHQAYPYKPDDGREHDSAIGLRVMRGGSFNLHALSLRAVTRVSEIPGYASNVGFRVALAPPLPK